MVSILDERHKSNELKIIFAEFLKAIHFRKDFFVILALINAKGILFFFAKRIKLGHISESIKKITSGCHDAKNFSKTNFTSTGKNL